MRIALGVHALEDPELARLAADDCRCGFDRAEAEHGLARVDLLAGGVQDRRPLAVGGRDGAVAVFIANHHQAAFASAIEGDDLADIVVVAEDQEAAAFWVRVRGRITHDAVDAGPGT